jgi:hypothetical protein
MKTTTKKVKIIGQYKDNEHGKFIADSSSPYIYLENLLNDFELGDRVRITISLVGEEEQ